MENQIRIALAGNPNCGKTTLFNALTGSNQFVGNWPGVTVEKKEGKLKKQEGVIVTDLPGIYSLSPYTLEEVVAREYLIGERPDAILNIVDGTNLERNLYLTTQLTELGIPVVVAINMMDVVKKNGDVINTAELSRALGCKVVEISALKGTGISEAADAAIDAAKHTKTVPMHTFGGEVEHALAHIEEVTVHDLPEEQQRWYAIKLFERDEKVVKSLGLSKETLDHIEQDIARVEKEMDDDAESIITNERYVYIGSIIKGCYKKKSTKKMTTSDKIDRVVTNRWAALPIFALIMFLVYFISVTTVGTLMTDFMNDGVFGDGFHLFGIGKSAYEADMEIYFDSALKSSEGKQADFQVGEAEKAGIAGAGKIADAMKAVDFEAFDEAYGIYGDALAEAGFDISEFYETYFGEEAENLYFQKKLKETDGETAKASVSLAAAEHLNGAEEILKAMEEGEFADFDEAYATYGAELAAAGHDISAFYKNLLRIPDTTTYDGWVPGIPVLITRGLQAINTPEWLESLIVDGIIGGVGAVLGFVPQIFVLFIFLAFLEACGYMARVAFVLDRIFRRFGLSGKSFIPMLIGSGCGVPGIMASRTIENERDRRMTIMTTTFIPCGAKLPIIALIASALFGGAWWVAPVAYFIGIAAIIVSGIMLKKTKMFAGDPAPFVMELPAYHWPTFGNVMRSMWERGWSFIKKAGTIILLASIVIWLGSTLGWQEGVFRWSAEMELADSILGKIGYGLKWIFWPLGFGSGDVGIAATIATIMGLVAKEEVVGVFGVLDFVNIGRLAGFSFLVFNLLCAPCFAAIGAIRREMNSAKWTWFAIGYQCGLAYAVSLMIYQFGVLFSGNFTAWNIPGLIAALGILGGMIYMLFIKKYHESNKLTVDVKTK